MGDKTGIEWTDATWNPTVGCSIVSPGCTNCYAMKQAAALERRFGSRKYSGLTRATKGGPVWTGEVRLDEAALDQPLRWRRPRRIFVNSMSDLFHESLPDEAIDRVFAVMALAPQHTFQVLTKRAERMKTYMLEDHLWTADGSCKAMQWAWPLPNVWIGVSAEDQPRWDERVRHLGATPAAVRFVSVEPMLGAIDAGNAFDPTVDGTYHPVDWVIVGGESGPGARPMHPDWARSLRDQCQAAGVAFFMKQMDKKTPIPGDLFVREMPHG